jgi:galactokinase
VNSREIARATTAFIDAFGHEPDILARAPGRVNLIGEHTDYNDGFVLPCAIDRATIVAASAVDQPLVEAVAADYAAARDQFRLDAPIGQTEGEWRNYVRGMAAVLIDAGHTLGGTRLAIAGNVPLGSGLSSSAALEIAMGKALLARAGIDLDATDLALLAQRAENDFVGCACGIMDQLISARAATGHAMLIDCRSLECRTVPMADDLVIIIAHSGVRHAHAGGEYNDRRAQCDRAARHYGVAALRDIDEAVLVADRRELDELTFRRARHVVTENARTLAAAAALAAHDLSALGELMRASHASMRDDFAITVPAVDNLQAIMDEAVGDEGGARMTGGGFGGCVIAITTRSRADAVVHSVEARFRDQNGQPAEIFLAKASGGATILDCNL